MTEIKITTIYTIVTRNHSLSLSFLRMHTVGQIPKCNQDIVETTVINIHDRFSSWFEICTLMKHYDGKSNPFISKRGPLEFAGQSHSLLALSHIYILWKNTGSTLRVPGENHRPWASNWQTLSIVSRAHLFCNSQSRMGTHFVFAIGLYGDKRKFSQ
jgi:hypothetical protein